ncbi:MAG TPA: TIGR02444 family protein [Dongiaceae bacterium]|nr:TIGR02444 family protein [Dongiaceae bacterium]
MEQLDAALSPDAFWEFSLAFYAREPVGAACLSLQDRRGADVNILLLCCWLATLKLTIGEPGLKAAIEAVADWRRDVLEPLRAVRRRVAGAPMEIAKAERRAIKDGLLAAELDCERAAQARIVAVAAGEIEPAAVGTIHSIAANALEMYLGLLALEPEEQDLRDIGALLEPL